MIHIKPDDAHLHFGLEFALKKKGDRRAAFEEYRKASKLDPTNENLRSMYEMALERLKR